MRVASAGVAVHMEWEEQQDAFPQKRQGPRCFTYSQGFQLTGLCVACASLISIIALVQLFGSWSSNLCSPGSRSRALQILFTWKFPEQYASRYKFTGEPQRYNNRVHYPVKSSVSNKDGTLVVGVCGDNVELKGDFEKSLLSQDSQSFSYQEGKGLEACSGSNLNCELSDSNLSYALYEYKYFAKEQGPLSNHEAFGLCDRPSNTSSNTVPKNLGSLPHPSFYVAAYDFKRKPILGGNAFVYRVTDRETQENFALKVASHPKAHLRREFDRMVALAGIPTIPRVYSFEEGDGSVFCDKTSLRIKYRYEYIIMEWFGQSVMESQVGATWIFEVLPGLLFPILRDVHHMGIIHCDVTLKNILFDGSLNLKLTDFGLSEPSRARRKMIKWMYSPLDVATSDDIVMTPSYDFELFGWVVAEVAVAEQSVELFTRALQYLYQVRQNQKVFDVAVVLRLGAVLKGSIQTVAFENVGDILRESKFHNADFDYFKQRCGLLLSAPLVIDG